MDYIPGEPGGKVLKYGRTILIGGGHRPVMTLHVQNAKGQLQSDEIMFKIR